MTDSMASEATVLMVGTRKGLWIGTSDEAREDWEFTGPHLDMEEVYSCLVDTRGDPPRLLRGRVVELARPAGALVRRPRRDLAGDPGRRRSGSPRAPARRVERVWQLVPGADADGVVWAGTEPGAVWRSTDGGETFELEQAALGPPAPRRVGRRVRRPGLPHDPAAPDRPGLGARSRSPPAASTRPPTAAARGSRATRASGRSSCPRASSTPSSASACTRWPGTRRGPSGSTCRTTAASTAPTTTAASWDYIGDGLPTDFGFAIVVHPHEPDTIFVFPISGGDGRYPPDAQGAGLALPRRRASLGGARRRAARRVLRRGDARRDVRRRPRAGRPVLRRAATAPCGPRPTRARPGAQIVANLPDVLVVRAAALPD